MSDLERVKALAEAANGCWEGSQQYIDFKAAVTPVLLMDLIAEDARSKRIQLAMVMSLVRIGEALGLSAEEQENGEEELIEAINQLKARNVSLVKLSAYQRSRRSWWIKEYCKATSEHSDEVERLKAGQ